MKIINERRILYGTCAIILLSYFIQLYILITSGAKTSVDSIFYRSNAEAVGASLQGRSKWYFGYSIFLNAIFSVTQNLNVIVLFQIIISAFTCFILFTLTKNITGSIISACFASAMYAVWLPVQEWNLYIYTESLFTSFCILSLAALVYSKTTWQYMLAVSLVLFTSLIRPSGLCLFIALLVMMLIMIYNCNRYVFFAIASCLVISGFIITNQIVNSYDPIHSYQKAEIIYPNITLGVSAPENLILPNSKNTLVRVIDFAWHNPVYFAKLFLIKATLYFGNIKPYYSTLHNILIIITLYPIYYLAAIGIRQLRTLKKEKAFIVSFIMLNGIIVGLTTENWDGRFLAPVLPFVFILASASIPGITSKLFKTSHPESH